MSVTPPSLPTQPAPPLPAPVPGKRRPSLARKVVLGVVVLALALAIAIVGPVLFARVALPGITKAQWRDVRLGSTRAQVLDQLSSRARTREEDTLLVYRADTYSRGLPFPHRKRRSAAFYFTGKRLDMKQWIEKPGGKASIDRAEYRSISRRMSEQGIVRRLGKPFLTEDFAVRRGALLGAFGPAGTSRCIEYIWAPDDAYRARFCFDQGTDDMTLKKRVPSGVT